jgi:hypothetical protein
MKYNWEREVSMQAYKAIESDDVWEHARGPYMPAKNLGTIAIALWCPCKLVD